MALIIFAAGLFWFAYPRYQRISQGDDIAMKNLRAEYEAKNNYLGKIKNLKKLYQQVSQAEIKKIEGMVPNDSKIINLIPEIESIILRNGAVLDSIKVEPNFNKEASAKTNTEAGKKTESLSGIFGGPPPKGVGRIKIEISLSSVSYQVLKNIIKTLENNLRLLDIAAISYAVQENSAVFTIYTYYLIS